MSLGHSEDTSRNLAGLIGFNGLQVVEDSTQVELVHHLRERKWAHRKRHKPEKRFNITTTTKPSRTVIRMGDKLIMHPAMANEIRRQLGSLESALKEPQLPNVSMGMRADPGYNWWMPSADTQRGFVDMRDFGIPIRPHNSIINLKGF